MVGTNEIDFDDENDGFSVAPVKDERRDSLRPHQQQQQMHQQHSSYRQPQRPASAILIQHIPFTSTEEDIRGYAVDVNRENEVKYVIFDEHKVNGKSKGNVYLEMETLEGAKAVKDHLETLDIGSNGSAIIAYINPTPQPFGQQHRQNNAQMGRGGTTNQRGRVTGHYQQQSHYPQQQQQQQQQFMPNPMMMMGFQNFGGGYNQWPQQQQDNNPHGMKRQRQ